VYKFRPTNSNEVAIHICPNFFCFRILTAREKRVRQKFHSETELQAYEKRLKDVEKKIRLLVKRGMYSFSFPDKPAIENKKF
jgi:predicted transcriptional regulator